MKVRLFPWSMGTLFFSALFHLFASIPSQACLVNVSQNLNSPPVFNLFPNWIQAKVTMFDLEYCSFADCGSWGGEGGDIVGLTLLNYGSANGTTDLTAIYFCVDCRTACAAPTQTMTYAGIWTVGASTYPAWTWAGALLIDADPCETGGGATPCTPTSCFAVMHVWVDVGFCPTNNVSVALGPNYNPMLDSTRPGGISDQYGCYQPWFQVQDQSPKTIVYASKIADKTTAAPGDTITYTIYYGRSGDPGVSPNLSQIVVFDSTPSYTNFISGSATPTPDAGLGDPTADALGRLRWTIPGPLPVTGGPTDEITFQVTVDWGNQPFDPDSGAVAAPENERLSNRAQVFFEGTSCSPTSAVTPAGETVVRRFLYWKDADNDLVFASSIGQPPDEIIYSIVMKNVSTSKTWWNVSVWDTVPAELNAWCTSCGFEDPCLGWTLTPSGCAAANPGVVVSGSNTILTWSLDMPPGFTLTLRWKAQVDPANGTARATAASTVSLLAYGFNGVNGTGHSGRPSSFTHLAPIMLVTTYVSYTSFFGGDHGNTAFPGIMITFFPLNKKTDFQFYGIEYEQFSGPYSTVGGVSASIGNPCCLIGTCTGGFVGFYPGGTPGCKVERIPALYVPAAWPGVNPDYPFHFIYKLVSNAPVLWQMLSAVLNNNQDHHFYDPATTLTYRGFTLYTYRRAYASSGAGLGDTLALINVSTDFNNAYDNTLTTTTHIFKWSGATNSWNFSQTIDLGAESVGVILGTTPAEEGFYRVLSSQANLIVHQSYNTYDTLSAGGCCDNFGTLAPNRETGNVVSQVGSGNFYVIVSPWGSPMGAATWTAAWVGNTSGFAVPGADATYKIWRYQPTGTSPAPMPPGLAGTSGNWIPVQTDTVPWGLFPGNPAPPNPHAYAGGYDRTGIVGPSESMFKIELLDGGPIQVAGGLFMESVFGGGAVMHAANGSQVGQEFWYHQTGDQGYNCGGGPDPAISPLAIFDFFCPKTGMAVRCVSSDGYDATYTTTGPDQVITFMSLSFINNTDKRVWKMNVLANGNETNIIALYNQCMASEKSYTSPFTQTGVHYLIVAPPVVFVGQNFWITVIVVEQGGATKTGYTGTSIFTSTDPKAQIESTDMSTYFYTWTGSAGEAGVKIFYNVTFTQIGQQTLVAADTADGSITGIASFMVVGVDVKLTKEDPLTVAASGDTVTFKICWSNYSTASAFNFTITDAVPVGTTYVPDTADSALCGSTNALTEGTDYVVAFSTSTSTSPPASFSAVSGGASPPAATRWLRWTLDEAGVNSTGCFCFRVKVD